MNVDPCSSWRLAVEECPLRCEPFGIERLDQHAKSIAERLTVEPGSHRNRKFFQRVEENARILRKTNQLIASQVRAGEVLEPDAEWLLDNFYIVEEQLREIRDDLPTGFLKELPHVADGSPRVQVLAEELICHTDSVLDGETLVRFVAQFQTMAPLSMGELWAFPIMLRLVLVENLRRIATQLLTTHACREEAVRLLKIWRDSVKPFWT